MKNLIAILLIFTVLFSLSGCVFKTTGENLAAFTERMNEISDYELTSQGYSFDEKENTFSKFYILEEKNILLSFSADKSNNLKSLNIIFDRIDENNPLIFKFVNDCIKAFVNDEEKATPLINSLQLEKTLLKESYETIKKENGSIEILIDTTEIGIVITVNKK